jgi:hypothetical protein
MSTTPLPAQTQQQPADLLGLHTLVSGLRDKYAQLTDHLENKILGVPPTPASPATPAAPATGTPGVIAPKGPSLNDPVAFPAGSQSKDSVDTAEDLLHPMGKDKPLFGKPGAKDSQYGLNATQYLYDVVTNAAQKAVAKIPEDMQSETGKQFGDTLKKALATILPKPGEDAGQQYLQSAGLKGGGIPEGIGKIEELSPGDTITEAGQKIKIPKGQQKAAQIQSTIEQAAADGKHVYLTYQHPDWDDPQVYKLEPYAYRGKDNQLLAARDVTVKPSAKDQGIRSFKLENVQSVVPAATTYEPHVDVNSKQPWKVELGQPSHEDLADAIVKSGQDPSFAEQRAKSLIGAATGAPGYHPSERGVAKELIKSYLAKGK